MASETANKYNLKFNQLYLKVNHKNLTNGTVVKDLIQKMIII